MPLLALVLAASLGSAAAPAARPPSTVLVLPFSFKGEGSPWTGVAIAESLIDFIAQVNEDNFFTLKQLDSVLRPRGMRLIDAPTLERNAVELGRALGATDVLLGEVSRKGDIWTVEARRLRLPDGAAAKHGKVQGTRAVLPLLTKKLAGDLTGTSTKA